MYSKNSILYRECLHKLRPPIARANTSSNPGRLFWGCQLWKIDDCFHFKWLPKEAVEAYMQLHGPEKSQIVDTAGALELLEQSVMITTLVDEIKTLKMRQEAKVKQPSFEHENKRLRMRVEAIVKEGKKYSIILSCIWSFVGIHFRENVIDRVEFLMLLGDCESFKFFNMFQACK